METKDTSTGNIVIHEPLTEGVTNQSYRATWRNKVVAYRKGRSEPEMFGINREREKQFFQTASFLGISPRLFASTTKTGEQVAQYLKGRHPLACELEEEVLLNKIIEIIKTYHKLNDKGKTTISGSSRLQLLQTHFASLAKHAHKIPSGYNIIELMNLAEKIDALLPETEPLVFSHKDLYLKNILIDQTQKVWLLDWEYSNWCTRYYDLATLITKNLLPNHAKDLVLKLYFGSITKNNKLELDINCALVSLQTAFWCLIQIAVFDCKGLDANLCKETAMFRINEFTELSKQLID